MNAFDLIKLEIMSFIQTRLDTFGKLPTNEDLHTEARCILSAAEAITQQDCFHRQNMDQSWLRDLIMSSPKLGEQTCIRQMRLRGESESFLVKLKGREKLFELCAFESQLREFIEHQRSNGTLIDDSSIQARASEIVRSTEKQSSPPSGIFATYIVELIYSSTDWLTEFKKRTGIRSTYDLIEGNTDLGFDLLSFSENDIFIEPEWTQSSNNSFPATDDKPERTPSITGPSNATTYTSQTSRNFPTRVRDFMPGDTTFNRYFVGDLARWVASTMSPTNPVSHMPSDLEIQHQARWIMYNE